VSPFDNRRRNNLPWPPTDERRQGTGRVGFDDRGNAVFEWASKDLSRHGEDADKARSRALDNPTLSLMDDEPKANAPIQENRKGHRVGYNPYESGMLGKKKEPPKKRDLRALSTWIEQRRKKDGGGEEK
jgi:hypothetical protein